MTTAVRTPTVKAKEGYAMKEPTEPVEVSCDLVDIFEGEQKLTLSDVTGTARASQFEEFTYFLVRERDQIVLAATRGNSVRELFETFESVCGETDEYLETHPGPARTYARTPDPSPV